VHTPADLLPRPPEEGARLLARSYLDAAAEARPRLDDRDDKEALHDFRVALRRLRSCLRAYRGELAGSLDDKLAKRLARLARATGPARDAEVQLEWLRESAQQGLAAAHRAGLKWLIARLEERTSEAWHRLGKELARDFDPFESGLRRALSVYRAEVHLDGGPRPTFAGATAAVLERQRGRLGGRLSAVRGPGDVARAHRARIEAKRLRYLLDPLAKELPGAEKVIKRLKGLQDLLGELHDAHVLEAEIEQALGEAAALRVTTLFELSLASTPDELTLRAERRRPREAGLLALARRNRARRDQLFAELAAHWLADRAAPFLAEVEALEGALRAAGGGSAAGGEGAAPGAARLKADSSSQAPQPAAHSDAAGEAAAPVEAGAAKPA
jgi:CHAD domain-containing protein